MELTTIRELFKNREEYLDKQVTVGGWIRSIRDSKTFGFIVLNDGSYFETLQVVYHDKMENFAEISKLNVGAAVVVKGTLVATPQAKQPFEIQADEVVPSASDYPLQKKRHSFEYLRTISHLRPRTNTFQAVFRVRSLAAYAIHKFFQERGFVYVHTPLITGSDCEGAGEMFRVTTMDMENLPKNEDGTVDFHTLENVNHIKSGDVVAILHPEDRGDNGTDILGRPVYPRKVKRAVFRYGKNMEVSEDKLKLISKVDGHVTLENDKVFVSNVLELVDVDASTGDINYSGSVMIKGNVLAGFSVKAAGDISVSGIVEGATIIADGDITFNRGVQGMNKAVIKAGGNIVSKFIESASSVEAGGNIEADSILHSKVRAKGTIKASGRNGLIVGGEVRSICLVEAKNIGNEMGTATVVGVGVDPAAKKRVDELKTSLQKLGDSKIQLNQIMTALRKKQEIEGKLAPDKVELQQKTMRNLVMIEKDLTEQKNELEQLRQQLGEDVNARVRVSGNIYVGVKLIFGEQNYFIKEKRTFCQFVKDKADIKWQSL